jgi:hypothetical protein
LVFNHFVLKLLFSWIWWIYFFTFQDTFNTQLKDRHEDDLSTHLNIDLDLWLKVGSYGELNRNRVYGLSNTTTENLRTTCSASTIECSQSILSILTLKFAAMLDQRVQDQTTHLNVKYERLIADSLLIGNGDEITYG